MFEKKQKRKSLLDRLPPNYEEIIDSSKSIQANRIYYTKKDTMYSINSNGVVKDLDTYEYMFVATKSYLKEEMFIGNIKLFRDENAEKEPQTLPDSLIDKKEEDGTEKEK